MSDSKQNADQGDKKRDEVLKRLLDTPPKPHKPKNDKDKNKGQDKESAE